MTAHEVVWFINHKYGEQAYVVETETQILLFTAKSKWIVQKTDYRRFGFYTLFHFNIKEGSGYHMQMRGNHIDFLVWAALTHDMDDFHPNTEWGTFNKNWQLYCLGREIEESVAAFQWLSGCSSVW